MQAQWKKVKPSTLEAGSVMAYAIAQSIGLQSHMHAFRYEGVVLICTLRIVADSQEHLTDSSAQHMQFSYSIISNIGASQCKHPLDLIVIFYRLIQGAPKRHN